MEENSSLGSLSLLMKGECLPAGTSWAGIPAQTTLVIPSTVIEPELVVEGQELLELV
jgi:hypothetical protein